MPPISRVVGTKMIGRSADPGLKPWAILAGAIREKSRFRLVLLTGVAAVALAFAGCRSDDRGSLRVGPSNLGMVVPTSQLLHPAGRSVGFHGRPVDLVLSPGGTKAYLKCDFSVFVVDVGSGAAPQEVKYPNQCGASLHGMALSRDGSRLYVTVAQSEIVEFATTDSLRVARTIPVRFKKEGQSYPCGIALAPDEKTAYVCLSANNLLAEVELASGKLLRTFETGIAPYDVKLSPDGLKAYVSNWGGRHAHEGERTAPSAGTAVPVDERGIAISGTISILGLAANSVHTEIEAGLHPSELVLSSDGTRFCVANANSDTISIINTHNLADVRHVSLRPQTNLPFGSAPNALAFSEDEKRLYVSNGGNNAIAVVNVQRERVEGFIPTGWYPGAVAVKSNQLVVANIKGAGTRDPAVQGKWSTRYGTWGTINIIPVPDASALESYTKQVSSDAMLPQVLRAFELGGSRSAAVPIPKRAGERSVFQHVIYIIKENRTYDQVFGDIGRGNSDPSLCIYGERVTPNQHALAKQFVLLDNYYCNGVLSPDGHLWATEGITTDFLEKSFGAWTRSYPSTGDDPLAYAPSGFIWDAALLRGLTFRNYGEFRYDTFDPFAHGGSERVGTLQGPAVASGGFKPHLGLPAIEPYTCPDFPGYTTEILDIERAEIFIRELRRFEQTGELPNLIIIYLPNNHTNGTRPGSRTPAAMVADNDLAVGKIVDAVSHGRYWKDTCIFVTEDDPQDGFDHVDGHRSSCLVVSAYTKRNKVVSSFYNQTSVLHTMELILGLRPMNQFDAMAPSMGKCFVSAPDLSPFSAAANVIPLDEKNPVKSALGGNALRMAEMSERLPLEQPDCADEDSLNRILWHSARPNDPYPIAFAGAHGKGLAKLHLKLDGMVKDDDD